jgi:hypothetical protein
MSGGFYLTYDESRARFLPLARAASARIERFPIEARGPQDERLTIDVAQLGAERPLRLLAVQSGTLGVEGFAGWRRAHESNVDLNRNFVDWRGWSGC